MNTLIALLIPPMLLVPAMGLLSAIESSTELGQELKRKTLHVAIGLAALSFPMLLTEPWMIVAALGLVLAWMGAVRRWTPLRRRFGRCLTDARRRSHGELYFALGVGFLLLVAAKSEPLYAIPLLILTFADAAAAIVGRSFPAGRLKLTGKTLTGCLAFATVAYLSALFWLLASTPLGTTEAALIALLVASTSSAAEAICRRGLDNLLVPLVAYFTLLPFELSAVA